MEKEIRRLAWKYFWKQKWNECKNSIMGIGIVVFVIFLIICIVNSDNTEWERIVIIIIFGLFVLFMFGLFSWLFYDWLYYNWKKAINRAKKELKR